MTALPPGKFLLPQTVLANSSTRLTSLLNYFQPSPETVVLLLAVLIGSSTGMGVVTFHYLIELVHHLMLENLMGAIAVRGAWTLACVPTLGGLIVGLMRWRWQDFGPGLSALIAVAHGNSVRSWAPQQLRPVTKMLAASVVGIAAVLAASAKAPLTAILLLFELTRDYRIVLPLMAAVGLSVWLVERLSPISTSKTNLNLPMDSNRVEPSLEEAVPPLLVIEAMNQSVLMLEATLPVLQAGLSLTRDRIRSALVIDEAEQLVGIVTLEDINRAISVWEQYAKTSNPGHINLLGQQLGEICTTDILYAYTDEPLSEALDRMAARGLHSVTSRRPKSTSSRFTRTGAYYLNLQSGGNAASTPPLFNVVKN